MSKIMEMHRLATSPTKQPGVPDSETELQPETTWVVTAEDGGQANVIIHNDDVTPMDFVLVILRQIFLLNAVEAERVMLRAHYTGLAYVQTVSLEEAKYRVGKAHSLARAAGYPLQFTIELEKAA